MLWMNNTRVAQAEDDALLKPSLPEPTPVVVAAPVPTPKSQQVTISQKPPNPFLHPIKWADSVPMTHPRAWRVFRTRIKPSGEFAMSVVTCIFSIAGAVRR